MSTLLLAKASASNQLRIIFGLALLAFLLLFLSFQVHFSGRSHELSESDQNNGILSYRPTTSDIASTSSSSSSGFSFVIKVLTYNRLQSLTRCLTSLASADYGSHTVKLHVIIDHFPLSDDTSGKLSSIDIKLNEAHGILNYVDGFVWPHGSKEIHYRTQNAGLQGQWLEAWWPASDNEFAFMVEDDMVLSPLYFKYLRKIIDTYYYDRANYDPIVYGISLQRPRFVPGKHGNRLQVDNGTTLFLYQLVGTWGQLLFPKPWKEFRIWYDINKSKNVKPLLDGMVTTGWYHRSKEKIWTPWFIKFVQSRGYFNLYTHFNDEQALSVSHRDVGVNTKREAGPDSTLIQESSASKHVWEMKPLNLLKRYDYCFHEILQGRIVRSKQDMYRVGPTVQKNGTIILVNAISYTEEITRNWLCQFSKFGMKNYIVILQDSKLEVELLRMGHAVVNIEIDQSTNEDMKGLLKVIKVIALATEIGYSVWITNVGTLWTVNPLHKISIENADIIGLKTEIAVSMKLMYCRGSKATHSMWEKLYNDLFHLQVSSSNSNAEQLSESSIGKMIWKSKLRFNMLPNTLITDIFEYKNNSDYQSSLLTGIQSNEECKSLLKSFGFWLLDDDLVCTGVFC